MAMVHPSRMGLVPQDPPKDRIRRSPSPDHRPRDRSRDRRDYGTSRASGRDSDRRHDDERRGRGRDERRDNRDDERSSRSRERGRRDDDGGAARPRRASPVYAEYRKPSSPRRKSPEYAEYRRPASPPRDSEAPRRQQETMYPARRERGGDDRSFAGDRRGFGGDGQDYFESRRQQRLDSTLSIWPPSPKAPARALSPERTSKSRKHKRSRSESVSSTEDSEDERRRRERKERKRARKEKERSEKKDRHRHRSRRQRSRTPSEDEEERERRRSRQISRTKSREPERRRDTRSRSPDVEHGAGEDDWVEKPVTGVLSPEAKKASDIAAASMAARDVSMEDSDEEVGPQPVYKVNASKKFDERAYGGALLRGEGSAMAAFLQDGTDTRIPRRGEIGLASDEIASFESVGYVMSGSRHHRMNAVRIRKENQVISAEEKRGILKLQQEERERREAILREEFQELLKEKLKGSEGRSG